MNPDGSDRVEVMDSKSVNPGSGYTGTSDVMAWNGIFPFQNSKLTKMEMNNKIVLLLAGRIHG